MTPSSYVSRSHYEFGDPVMTAITAEEAHDTAKASARGLRIAAITETVVHALNARGLLRDPSAAPAIVFHVLADALYGNAALDVPPLEEHT